MINSIGNTMYNDVTNANKSW